MDIENAFTRFLRKRSRPAATRPTVRCSLCDTEVPDATEILYTEHLRDAHAHVLDETDSQRDQINMKIQYLWNKAQEQAQPIARLEGKEINDEPQQPASPTSSLKREGSRSQSPPKRTKACPPPAPAAGEDDDVFDRRPPQQGTLWNPDDDQPPRQRQTERAAHRLRTWGHQLHKPARSRSGQPQSGGSNAWTYGPVEDDETPALVKQPETKPISQEQLVAEVKGIYAGLVMVESKCIEVDSAQNAQNETGSKLNNEQWQALIALHRTLLHEHHDFFLASQHPSASLALRRLASKYAMPARMWRHGIHSFLELLRHRLPASLEHMLSFIYLAYSMMALLYETVPTFEDTWIECLGDLGRYRMAIEDDDIHDRDIWTSVSRRWYSKASDKAPTTGRLYHHLAILARPNALQQLYYYTKSLCVDIQFESARDSIMTLLDPIMALAFHQSRLAPTEVEFVRCHGILFSKKFPEKYETSANEFINSLDNHIARTTRKFLESGYHLGITACCAIVGYGDHNNPIYHAIKVQRAEAVDQPMAGSGIPELPPPQQLVDSVALSNRTHNVVFRRFGDPNILPYLHVTLVFLHHLTFSPEGMSYVESEYPWKLTSLMLNTLMASYKAYPRIESDEFPQLEKEELRRPLPEDYALRGLLWVDRYFPAEWFVMDKTEDDEKYMELPSMEEERKERILWLAHQIAARGGKWLRYDSTAHRFTVAPQYDVELEGLSSAPARDLGELPDALPASSAPL